jgi:nitrogen fixation protein FixH
MPTMLPASGAEKPGSARPRELTGAMVLAIFSAFFLVVFAMNGVMVRYAVTTFGGVEVASAYRAGLDFNREAAAADAQARLGWTVEGNIQRAADGTAVLILAVRGRDGRRLAVDVREAQLNRPADRRMDKAFSVRAVGDELVGEARDVAPGQWDFVLTLADRDGALFKSRNRVVLK